MNHTDQVPNEEHTTSEPEGKHEKERVVEVELNGEEWKIRAGKYTGRTLKLALGVPAEHELDQVVHQEFRPIADDETIHIKGGEKFVSHCGQGQSS